MTESSFQQLDDNGSNPTHNIGKCKKCQYFDVQRDEEMATDETLAPCLHPDMEEFALLVSGDSGCNLFEMCEDLDEDEDLDDDETLEDNEEIGSTGN